jgi:RimJ/RimL family protein N-acetyltransferase
MRRAGIRQGAYYDMVVTDILRSEWEGGRNAAGR